LQPPNDMRTTVLRKGASGSGKHKHQATMIDLAVRTHDLQEANKTSSFVAHELNNLLTVIQISSEFLLETAGENPASAQELGYAKYSAPITSAERRRW
jgi:signal transduction histidine kinase